MTKDEYVSFKEAAKEYGVSRPKFSRLVSNGELRAYENPKDKRYRLLKRGELADFLRIRKT